MAELGRRGRYRKGVEMRERIIDTALEAYAESDSRGPSIRAIAERVGLTDKGIGHYFASRDELLMAVLQERDRLDAGAFDAEDSEWLSHVVARVASRNGARPGLVKLYLDLAVAAGDPDHVAHDFFVGRYEAFRSALCDALERRGADPVTARWQAAAVLAVADGIQVQWLLDPRLDIAEVAVGMARMIERGSPTP